MGDDERVARALVRLGELIAGAFPHHGKALRDELSGRRLTNERWNRAAAILASLRSLPGSALLPAEHVVRNLALGAIEVPRQMAMATFGRGDESAAERAVRWTAELEKEMER